MDATQWIIVLIVVVVVVALAAWLMAQRRKKQQQAEAERLRQDAHQQASEIPEAQARAREAEAEAERTRLEAERAQRQAQEAQVAATQQQAVHEDRLRTADEVDPRVDTSADDYSPRDSTHDPDTILDADDPRRTEGDGTTRP